jgi:hypothetical protein
MYAGKEMCVFLQSAHVKTSLIEEGVGSEMSDTSDRSSPLTSSEAQSDEQSSSPSSSQHYYEVEATTAARLSKSHSLPRFNLNAFVEYIQVKRSIIKVTMSQSKVIVDLILELFIKKLNHLTPLLLLVLLLLVLLLLVLLLLVPTLTTKLQPPHHQHPLFLFQRY